MASLNTKLENMAIGLARELPHLRPSQQRQLAQLLETREQLTVFGRAIELALRAVVGDSDEIMERVYLLGLEVRQIFDARSATALHHLEGQWESIPSSTVEAFVGGFRRDSFEEVMRRIRIGRVPSNSDDFTSYDYDLSADDGETFVKASNAQAIHL